MAVVFTVGHSTRPVEELIAILERAGVTALVDVRTVPRSRRNPQYEREALSASLPAAGVAYRHEPALGGFRRPSADSPNGGWEHPSFRAYADYMLGDDFRAALDTLDDGARRDPTAIMCAEAQWWRCHRRLIADALTVRGWEVLHLGLGARPVRHQLTPFAVVSDGGELRYPPARTAG